MINNERLFERTKDAAQKLVAAFEKVACANVTVVDHNGKVVISASDRLFRVVEVSKGKKGTWEVTSIDHPSVYSRIYLPSTHPTPNSTACAQVRWLLEADNKARRLVAEQEHRKAVVEEVKRVVGDKCTVEPATFYSSRAHGYDIGETCSFTIKVPIDKALDMAAKLAALLSPPTPPTSS